MIVTIHQPAYLPWLGYFHKIIASDIFVFFDTTQFEKNSFINRNKIKTPHGQQWLTVPVKLKDHLGKEIKRIEVADQKWQDSHWKSIELNYRKAKYFDQYADKIKSLYHKKYSDIAEVCYAQLLVFSELLEVKTKIVKSSDLKKFESKKDDLVLDICQELKATAYVSGAMGRDYIDLTLFEKSGIKLHFQDYQHPVYEQLWGDFMPYMSIIDLLFNEGSASKEIILSNNVKKYG